MAKKDKATQPQWEVKDRLYVLTGGRTPVNLRLRSKHSQSKPLQYFDGTINRSLRYSTSHSTVFMDEQYGDVTRGTILFTNGTLKVPASDVTLQQLLSIYHPDRGVEYEEFDPNRSAEIQIAAEEEKIEAQRAVLDMDIEELEAVARVALSGRNVSDMSSKEIKRDMIAYARVNPRDFMELANDENIKLRNVAVRSTEMGIIKLMQDRRTFVWNDKTREKIYTAPVGENAYTALAEYFKTDVGYDILQGIQNKL